MPTGGVGPWERQVRCPRHAQNASSSSFLIGRSTPRSIRECVVWLSHCSQVPSQVLAVNQCELLVARRKH